MAKQNGDTEMPRTCELLTQLNDHAILNAKQLAFALGIAGSSAYAKYHDSDLSATQLHRLFHADIAGVNRVAVQSSILSFLIEGTPWVCGIPDQRAVSGDADFDTRVAFDEAITALRICADAIELRRAADKAGLTHLDNEDVIVLNAEIGKVNRKLRTAHAALELLAKQANHTEPQA